VILVASFVAALVLSAVLVRIGRAIASRLGPTYLTRERGRARKPIVGGIAIALTLLAYSIPAQTYRALPVLLVSSAVLLFVGMVSDLRRLKPATRVVAMIVVACVFLFFDFRLHWSNSVTFDSVLTVLWIVGIIGAFNILDTMDGLCGGIALIAGAGFLLTTGPSAVAADSVLFLPTQHVSILLGAITGFLAYNVHPASVALGTGGSLLIGLNMAAMTLNVGRGRSVDLLSILAVPLLVLLIPMVNQALPALARMLPQAGATPPADRRAPPLVAIGLPEGTAVALLCVLAAATGLIGVLVGRSQQGVLLQALFTIGMMLFAVYLARVHVHEDAVPGAVSIPRFDLEFGYPRRVAEVLLDLLLISVAYYGAYRLRFEGEFARYFDYFAQSLPVVLGVQIVVLFAVGVYRGLWRYFTLSDGITFIKAVGLGVLLSQSVILYVYRFQGYSVGVFFIYALLLLVLLVGSRASVRVLDEYVQRQRFTGRRLVIYGAGDAGALAVRHLLNDTRGGYRIEGFIDEDVRKRNARMHGYKVIGGYDHLVGLIMAGEIDVVAIAHERADTAGLVALCSRHNVTLLRLSLDWREIAVGGSSPQTADVALDRRVIAFEPGARARPPEPVMPAGQTLAARIGRVLRPPQVAPPATQPIRVAHVITRLILGGAQENTLYTVLGQLKDPRFEVTLVCGIDEAGEGNMFTQASTGGVKTVVLPSLLREIRPFTDIRAFLQLYRFFRKNSFTIVHTHSSKAGILGRLAARAAGVPVVVHTIHGVAFHTYQAQWKNRLYIALERLCAPMSDRIISVSRLLSETALAQGIGQPHQYVTVFSGIDLDVFLSVSERLSAAEAKRRLGIPADAMVVGKIGRLFPLKGHDQFLAAAAAIAKDVPNVYFLFVGDGPLKDQLSEDARQLGLGDRLVMVGRVPPETVPDYIHAMDVVVHTSLREGIARVLPQAGAVGKPVVTYRLDGAPEVIHDGVSGYLVSPLDINHVAERTVQLLRDPELRERFGQAGRTFAVEHFSLDSMVTRINELYLTLLADRAAAAFPLDTPPRP
jgi:glycosyltransferase involved in cell wall biosynthesis/UDP-N-acetylmuramyl pentapeptide phosphotransferase/UDP-N-acetylglucosamine-1-phosphate transferase